MIINDTTFKNNWRTNSPGAALKLHGVRLTLTGGMFYHNTATSGGAINSFSSDAVIDDTIFTNNHATTLGGAISSRSSDMFIHNSQFRNNSAMFSGGAIYYHISSGITDLKNTIFERNSANASGGAVMLYHTVVSFYDCHFRQNHAGVSGGALHLLYRNLIPNQIKNSSFELNYAGSKGGAIYCNCASTKYFIKSEGSMKSNFAERGGFLCASDSNLLLEGKFNIHNNKAVQGGAIYANHSSIHLKPTSTVTVFNNTAENAGGALYMNSSEILIFTDEERTLSPLDQAEDNNYSIFNVIKNRAIKGSGGGIYATASAIIFLAAYINITDNVAEDKGGGLFLQNSQIHSTDSQLSFNHL